MDDKMMIPYVAHEGIVDRMERTIKKLWILVIIFIVAFLLSNVAWLYVYQLYDYADTTTETTETTYTQDGQGNNIIGNSNEVTNGSENSTKDVTHNDEEPHS
jgi:hypothetical protein